MTEIILSADAAEKIMSTPAKLTKKGERKISRDKRTAEDIERAADVAYAAGEKSAVRLLAGKQERRAETIRHRDRLLAIAHNQDARAKGREENGYKLLGEAKKIAHSEGYTNEAFESKRSEAYVEFGAADAYREEASISRQRAREFTMRLGTLPAGNRKLRRKLARLAQSFAVNVSSNVRK